MNIDRTAGQAGERRHQAINGKCGIGGVGVVQRLAQPGDGIRTGPVIFDPPSYSQQQDAFGSLQPGGFVGKRRRAGGKWDELTHAVVLLCA
jgi:hypothetical protein